MGWHGGDRIGRWRLRTLLGRGAFGETWRATRDDGVLAAIKLLDAPPAGELRALARLSHPAIPQLLDTATAAPWFIVMELAPGESLSRVLAGGALPLGPVLKGLAGLFDALATVHAAGLRHGDVKPSNIVWMATAAVPARLIDFGLAERTGLTPAWAAPEVRRGRPSTAASDVYSLARVAQRMLLDNEPSSPGAHEGMPLQVRSRGPEWLRALLYDALHFDPSARPTAAAIVDVFCSHGHLPPPLDPAWLRRRAAALRIDRPEVDQALAEWRHRGGLQVLTGEPGSGLERTLDSAVVDLAADGQGAVCLFPSSHAWGGLAVALRSMGLQMPAAPDDPSRVPTVAAMIAERGVPIVVYDYEHHDRWTQAVVDRLVALSASVLVGSPRPPAWADDSLPLGRLDDSQLSQLLVALLGDGSDLAPTREAVRRMAGGLLEDSLRFVVGCVEAEAFQRSGTSWVLDERCLPELSPSTGFDLLPRSGTRRAAVLLLLSHLRCPLSLSQLARLTDLDHGEVEVAVRRLTLGGLVSQSGEVVTLRLGVARVVRARLRVDQAWLRRTLGRTRSLGLDNPVPLAWLAVALGEGPLLEAVGPRAVPWLIRRNPSEAAQLSRALWEACPSPATLIVHLRALAAAGLAAEALELAVHTRRRGAMLDAAAASDASLLLRAEAMAVVADLLNNHFGKPDKAREWCAAARSMLGRRGDPAPERLTLAEAMSHGLLGDHHAAVRLLADRVNVPPPADDEELATWLRVRTCYAQSLHELGQREAATGLLQDVPAELGGGLPERAVLAGALGRILWMAGHFREADAALSAASAEQGGLKVLDRARLLSSLGATRASRGLGLAAVAAWEQARNLFESVGQQLESARMLSNLCLGYHHVGRWERARQSGQLAMAFVDDAVAPHLVTHAVLNLASLEIDLGHHDAARQLLDDARRRLQAHADGPLEAETAHLRAWMAVEQGAAEAPARVRAAIAAAEGAGSLGYLHLGGLLGLRLEAAGDPVPPRSEVERRVSVAIAALGATGGVVELAIGQVWAAQVFRRIGHPSGASALEASARRIARAGGLVFLERRLDQLLAMASASRRLAAVGLASAVPAAPKPAWPDLDVDTTQDTLEAEPAFPAPGLSGGSAVSPEPGAR